MRRSPWFAIALAHLLTGAALAQPPDTSTSPPNTAQSANSTSSLQDGPIIASLGGPIPAEETGPGGAPADSRPGREAALAGEPESKLGPAPVHEAKLLQNFLRDLCHAPEMYDASTGKAKDPPLKIYGWLDMGYTYASSGSGPLSVETRPNHFGREFSLNQLALTIEKPLDPNTWSWGFLFQPYAGADATLYSPIRGALLKNPDPRFGLDIRNLYVQAHLPILTEGGVDVEVGHHYPLFGFQSAMAPYRTFYSNDYQWFYGEPAAFTGAIVTWHVNKQLDIVNAVTLGYLTYFNRLSVSPTYMGRIDYWFQEEKKTLLSLGWSTGPVNPDSNANTTLACATLTQNWNKYLTQVVQFGMGYSESGIFVPGLERYYGLYSLWICHANPKLDVNFRLEWYNDVDGRSYPGGTGFATNYEEFTVGLDYHPNRWLQIRPELRADFANNAAAFGPVASPNRRSQFTPAIECLIKF